MKILAIDSSGLTAATAVIEDDIILAEYSIQTGHTHSQTLLPLMEEIRSRIGLDLDSIDAYAVAAGPGSFTGLRIGIATVKGLGIAKDKPVAAVPTLEALAYNLYGAGSLVCPIMDARRSQVYTGIYEFAAGTGTDDGGAGILRMRPVMKQSAMAFDELGSRLSEIGRPVIFTGDGIPVFSEKMKELLTCPYETAPAHMSRQRAASLATLALAYMKGETDPELEGEVTDADSLDPIYLRMSQAEREKMERGG
ncbi:MAG: tRNA (adenosine(37)-N6)-threonylcarbamoyltransferase complex dimerization subunit type 1 TsaB [Lachnospiraceae bacterium]|nr:tRNA (adenosine(37)-N6)-threonylcarbamoyltransferase complex dimerization subunit type 1 TsaB [Lachnospiraceae bacterium]